MMDKTEYLKMQYQEALNQARCYIDSRYKILQFIGFFNAAVLTFGFSENVISTSTPSMGAILLCILSAFVAIMGLATEFSLISYNKEYFSIIKKIENILNNQTGVPLEEIGVFSHGAKLIEEYFSHKLIPVNIAHRVFYIVLSLFWIAFLFYQLNLYAK